MLKMNGDPQTKSGISVDSLLISVGIMPNKRGYGYIKELIASNRSYQINSIYGYIAKRDGTNVNTVERSVRTAISAAQSEGKLENLNKILGCKVYDCHGKIKSREFISIIAEFLYGKI